MTASQHGSRPERGHETGRGRQADDPYDPEYLTYLTYADGGPGIGSELPDLPRVDAPRGDGDMRDSSSRGIFLSYRRKDSAPHASALRLQLSQRLPDAEVFMDLGSVEPGRDFAAVIEEAVNSCAVLVALIGRKWATLTDKGGRRRLDDPHDYVRVEVQAALSRRVRLIPVLVDGAKPPRDDQLPAELRELARLQAHTLSKNRYNYDIDRLLEIIERLLETARGTSTGHR